MGRKHRRRDPQGRAASPAPAVAAPAVAAPAVPQLAPAPAPTRWRDPTLVVSILSAVVAMVAAFYAYKQASVGREQLAHGELIAQHRALAVGVRVFGDVESALGRCLHTVVHVEDCGAALQSLEPDLLQAANDPEVATYYPLIHMELESIYFDVRTEQVDAAIKTLKLAAPRISTGASHPRPLRRDAGHVAQRRRDRRRGGRHGGQAVRAAEGWRRRRSGGRPRRPGRTVAVRATPGCRRRLRLQTWAARLTSDPAANVRT